MSNPKCKFNRITLTVTFGSRYKHLGELNCLQIPAFKQIVMERSDEGNGWYGPKIPVEKVIDNYYLILHNGKAFGILHNPYTTDIFSDILSIDDKHPEQVIKFINHYR